MYVESVITDTASRVALAVERGSPHPLGASPRPGGVNFSPFSENATGMELLLFAAHDAPQPFR
jgi:isoamylase